MEEKNVKNENVTRKNLEEQTQVLLSAFDKRFNQLSNEVKGVRNELYIVRTELKEEIKGVETKLEKKIDSLQASVDGFAKKQADFEDENVIMKEESRQMKNAFKEKLGVEIRAI